MSDYVLSCESAVDLTREHLGRRKVPCICYSYASCIATYNTHFAPAFGAMPLHKITRKT